MPKQKKQLQKRRKPETIVKFIDWYDAGIWPATIMFAYRFGYDDLMAHLKKVKAMQWHTGLMKDKELIDNGNHFGLVRYIENEQTKKEIQLFYIIIKPEFTFSDWDFCMLAHEVLHICQFLLRDILDVEREFEAFAYTHTFLMERCLKSLRNEKR